MARLNEATVPTTESIDALKRRFVRQNREIARANSNQSVRIRNLECEVSRLLSENASLREEVIRLQIEMERSTSRISPDNLDAVKGKLEKKLLELGTLVRGLGETQKDPANPPHEKRVSVNQGSPKRSPDKKKWRNALTLSEVLGNEDGRLPPILEDKCYPRRTLSGNAEDFSASLSDPANITDSPELGPPPIAHFEDGDPIKFDVSKESREMTSTTVEQNARLSANLETRKRRRESTHRKENDSRKPTSSPEKPKSYPGPRPDAEQPLKIGAKRKLNVHEESNMSDIARPGDQAILNPHQKDAKEHKVEMESLRSTLGKTAGPTLTGSNQANSGASHIAREVPVQPSVAGTARSRRALEPKSVNSDPTNSPLKSRGKKEQDSIIKEEFEKPARSYRSARDSKPSKSTTSSKNEVKFQPIAMDNAAVPLKVAPGTPLPPFEDVFSPVSSNPSASRVESNDTPPPPDLGKDTGNGSFGRQSRRQRGSVNYAQPNLRDKMRRPTAELVDAVAAEERARQASIAKAAERSSDAELVKQEGSGNGLPIWKTNEPRESYLRKEDPASPLDIKTGDSSVDLPYHITTERRGRSLAPPLHLDDGNFHNQHSGAASAIAALVGKHQRLKTKDLNQQGNCETKDQAAGGLAERSSIFDFTGSSPHTGEKTVDETPDTEAIKTGRTSRRHSSVPPELQRGKNLTSISRRGDRRKGSILNEQGEGNHKAEALERPPSRARSVLEAKPGVNDAILGKGDKAASRRRSMML